MVSSAIKVDKALDITAVRVVGALVQAVDQVVKAFFPPPEKDVLTR